MSCLSSCSYIKPQLRWWTLAVLLVVYHLVPTSNHNTRQPHTAIAVVVYHLVPTSNHNRIFLNLISIMLFIILFLHQTTTGELSFPSVFRLFIILFLHQTTTSQDLPIDFWLLFIILFLHQTTTGMKMTLRASWLFIILFLHQTTTGRYCPIDHLSCLSSCSYIKPQHVLRWCNLLIVVYHLVPTSNHNYQRMFPSSVGLFIILFLHQTTTLGGGLDNTFRCLSSCSYIKPQRHCLCIFNCYVVYHLVPTSNHNSGYFLRFAGSVVYHLVPTSNHNTPGFAIPILFVVYHLVPTSNHNLKDSTSA